ncbi:Uma2 family endonuclease [cyanobacterium endosymbiont of Epithemia clementina EcSB]|nr:Uma2 family endonuclease [cyanobacterium endosymbiont of Epithemia clementina EcSB]WGT67002.1 Uma2 family endonuclease [cyanobacterium endosymbiont of Epithemia clementina EcSB]
MAEVIRSDWQNDYARKKVEDYAVLGIREYSIADYVRIRGDSEILESPNNSLYLSVFY